MAADDPFELEELLSAEDVLAHGDLSAPVARGAADLRVGVRCGRPLLYPVPADDLPAYLRQRAQANGGRYVGAMFAFDLDAAPSGHRYAAARFTVDLDDDQVTAARVHGDGGQLGLQAWLYVANSETPA